MSDAVTIVVIHISRAEDQPLLHVGQEFRLEASPDLPEHISEACHLLGSNLPIQPKPIEPGHLTPYPGTY